LLLASALILLPAADARAQLAPPGQGVIRNRRLSWPDSSTAPLAGNSFLSIRVDPEPSFPGHPGADVQLILASTELKIVSLLGVLEIPYPAGWIVSLNRADARALLRHGAYGNPDRFCDLAGRPRQIMIDRSQHGRSTL
jgi:hypothetical protein